MTIRNLSQNERSIKTMTMKRNINRNMTPVLYVNRTAKVTVTIGDRTFNVSPDNLAMVVPKLPTVKVGNRDRHFANNSLGEAVNFLKENRETLQKDFPFCDDGGMVLAYPNRVPLGKELTPQQKWEEEVTGKYQKLLKSGKDHETALSTIKILWSDEIDNGWTLDFLGEEDDENDVG